MILADKIIELRKKNGWSQEELAEQLNVSRQAVSKWEGAQSMPDLTRILQMAELFGVTTDYLLKDEIEEEEKIVEVAAASPVRRVTMEEANEFIEQQTKESGRIALGVLLCIMSPICLLSLGGAAAFSNGAISDVTAGVIGVVVLLIMVAAAVAMFIMSGMKSEKWNFLEKEAFETEYGVTGMVRERQKEMRPGFVRAIVIGVVLCILSPVPLMLSGLAGADIMRVHTVSLLLAMVGLAVVFFIRAGMPWEALEKLLQEGDYTAEKKRSAPLKEAVGGVYWTVATAIYLGWSFAADAWKLSWIIWPVAGVLFAAVMVIVEALQKRRQI